MLVQQISVFIENKPGQALKPIVALADAGIDLCAISIADTKDFGILRIITRDNEKAIKILKEIGCTTTQNDLIGVVVEDTPGGLAAVLQVFKEEDINIEYLYSYLPRQNQQAIMFFKVEQTQTAKKKLDKHRLKLVSLQDI